MGVWDRLRAWLRREGSDIDEALDEMAERGHAALDRRERELQATPAERLAMEQQRAEQLDEDFEAVRRRIEGESTAP